jgi:hypothetical protein
MRTAEVLARRAGAYWLLTEKLDTQTEMAAHRDGVATDC